mmetsp:Transcript_14832/g.37143  ORF Transcript_14832/g.37143 Transcript_14832/m.37143 type:complete len:232 (-) Transcript_14832:462-1157(-)
MHRSKALSIQLWQEAPFHEVQVQVSTFDCTPGGVQKWCKVHFPRSHLASGVRLPTYHGGRRGRGGGSCNGNLQHNTPRRLVIRGGVPVAQDRSFCHGPPSLQQAHQVPQRPPRVPLHPAWIQKSKPALPSLVPLVVIHLKAHYVDNRPFQPDNEVANAPPAHECRISSTQLLHLLVRNAGGEGRGVRGQSRGGGEAEGGKGEPVCVRKCFEVTENKQSKSRKQAGVCNSCP